MIQHSPHPVVQPSLPKPGQEDFSATTSLPVVGIIGGGQLARMMAQAALALGLPLRLLAEGPDVSAVAFVHDTVVADYTDEAAVLDFAQGCDVVTFDHEHVPTSILQTLQAHDIKPFPGPDALIHAQDKAVMRQRLSDIGIPCPTWAIVTDQAGLENFGQQQGWPIIAKVSRGGYDGHGVWKIDGPGLQCLAPFAGIDSTVADPIQVIVEEFVPFVRELSVLVAQSPSGQAVSYPVSQTVQSDGICVETLTPAPDLSPQQQADLQQLGLRIAQELGTVGILAVELMQRSDGSVVVNELAMRPHNTGHWTIDGAITSQFENHLRAVADLPLGSSELRADCVVMHNVLGGHTNAWPDALNHVFAHDPQARLHWYGKSWRQGRKLGHVTCLGNEMASTRQRARHAALSLRGEQDG